MLRKLFTSTLLLSIWGASTNFSMAQRQAQPLGRGVVAGTKNGSTLITWRQLAQDPENARWNVYIDGSLANATPLTCTNYKHALSAGQKVTVAMVDAAGNVSPQSAPWTYAAQPWSDLYSLINYKTAGSPLPDNGTYDTKFIWPVDLTGDGEYDFVVDRLHKDGGNFTNRDSKASDYIEGYTHDGRHLWTVQLGPNIFLSKGQNDGLTVGDFDCDGIGDVIVQVSDSCRLWDASNKSWGSWLVTDKNDGTTPDADGDGIINYTHPASYYGSGKNNNPQYYMLVVNGLNGSQKACVPMTLAKDREVSYTRTNKSAWMGDEYPYMSAAMGTAYLDGIHPSAVAQFQLRTAQGAHHYFTYAYSFFPTGKEVAEQNAAPSFHEAFTFAFYNNGNPSEFHHLRIGDVDEDGKDEVMNGAFALDHDGTVLWNAGIAHGDRFRLSDINPERPGQEIFAIQQNAGDMLGQILYDATDGSSIKRWYLSAVGDVGRGECADVIKEHKGLEMWSTMPNMYNAKGELVIEGYYSDGSFPYPTESVWWDGELDREQVNAPDGKYNADIRKFNYSKNGNRLIEMAKESNYQMLCEYGIRPLFWGDIRGDWREEIILKHKSNGVTDGFGIYTTDIATSVNYIYCLQQDPNYRGQCTNRGYYQSPMTSFYLGYDMPRPQLPPFMTPQRVWGADEATWNSQQETSILFGLGGNRQVTLGGNISTDTIFFVVPSDYDYTIAGTGKLLGHEIWKTGAGEVSLANGISIEASDSLYLSEGTLRMNDATIATPVSLRARGTLAGQITLKKGLVLEGALNYTGGRLAPSGLMTIEGDLNISRRLTLQLNQPGTDRLVVTGNVSLSDSLQLVLPEELQAGQGYAILSAASFEGFDQVHLGIKDHEQMQYHWSIEENVLKLYVEGYIVKEPRTTPDNITWTGAEDGTTWDNTIENWKLEDGSATNFVSGDHVSFVNTANGASIKLDMSANISGLTVNNTHALPIVGKGYLTGAGALIKKGSGQLSLALSGTNAWHGGTYLMNGTLAQGTWATRFGNYGDTIHVTQGVIQMFENNSSSTMPTLDYVYALTEENSSLTIYESSRGKLMGKVIGQGTLTLHNKYVRADNYLNLENFEGTLVLNGPSDNGEHRFINTTVNMRKGCLKVLEGMSAQGYKAGGGTQQSNVWNIGSVAGKGRLGTGTWNVGYDNTDFTMECTIAGSFHKYGTGIMQCANGMTFSPTIHEGIFYVKTSSTSDVTPTSGLITIANGGTLQSGGGKIEKVTVNAGGTLRIAALTGGVARIRTYFKTLTLKSGAKVAMRYCPSGADINEITGTITMTDPHILLSTPANQTTGRKHEWAIGDTIKCFTFTDTNAWKVSGTVTVEMEEGSELPDGLMWDTDTFLLDATLRLVADPNAIDAVRYDENGQPIFYDIQGRRLKEGQKGITHIVNGKKRIN